MGPHSTVHEQSGRGLAIASLCATDEDSGSDFYIRDVPDGQLHDDSGSDGYISDVPGVQLFGVKRRRGTLDSPTPSPTDSSLRAFPCSRPRKKRIAINLPFTDMGTNQITGDENDLKLVAMILKEDVASLKRRCEAAQEGMCTSKSQQALIEEQHRKEIKELESHWLERERVISEEWAEWLDERHEELQNERKLEAEKYALLQRSLDDERATRDIVFNQLVKENRSLVEELESLRQMYNADQESWRLVGEINRSFTEGGRRLRELSETILRRSGSS